MFDLTKSFYERVTYMGTEIETALTGLQLEQEGPDENYVNQDPDLKIAAHASADRQYNWDLDYLKLASYWASLKSKDPSTKVGAVVVSKDNRVVGMGYNGFPVGVNDDPERYNHRETKYKFVVHAEPNALLTAGDDARGGTLYTTLFTCNECAKLVIQAGIERIVTFEEDPARWSDSHAIAKTMYYEAGIGVYYL